MTRAAVITIEFSDWWLSGTGRAGSGDVDAVPHRVRFGCPALPMTQVKGQLRESAERLARTEEAWRQVHQLFGWRKAREGEPDIDPPDDPRDLPGKLAFQGDATLDPHIARWFQANPAAREQLTRRRMAVKIGPLGAADDQMLRAVEAAVPVTLRGSVHWISDGEPPEKWVELLDTACAATLAFGKNKTDGYGRAIASCTAADPESLA